MLRSESHTLAQLERDGESTSSAACTTSLPVRSNGSSNQWANKQITPRFEQKIILWEASPTPI